MEIKYYSNRAKLIKEANEEQRKHPFTFVAGTYHECDHGNCYTQELVDNIDNERLILFVECGECEINQE